MPPADVDDVRTYGWSDAVPRFGLEVDDLVSDGMVRVVENLVHRLVRERVALAPHLLQVGHARVLKEVIAVAMVRVDFKHTFQTAEALDAAFWKRSGVKRPVRATLCSQHTAVVHNLLPVHHRAILAIHVHVIFRHLKIVEG